MKYLTKQEQIVLCLILALVSDRLGREGLSHGTSVRPGGLRSKNPDMRPANLEDDIRKIVAADPRYHYEAYVFVQEALKHTQRALGRAQSQARPTSAARNCSTASASTP